VRDGDLLADAAGDQLAQGRVQPAGDPGLVPTQVMMPPRPHPQHRAVIIGRYLADRPGAERRDRDRPGVVRVVLVHRLIRQQPDPGGQLRLHVQDPLPGRDQTRTMTLRRNREGTCFKAAASTFSWSVKVFEPALPGLSFMARHSRVLQHQAPKGWKPYPFFHVGAAPSLSE
jgi:hypothetical protein